MGDEAGHDRRPKAIRQGRNGHGDQQFVLPERRRGTMRTARHGTLPSHRHFPTEPLNGRFQERIRFDLAARAQPIVRKGLTGRYACSSSIRVPAKSLG
jgi:hypothetical protein